MLVRIPILACVMLLMAAAVSSAQESPPASQPGVPTLPQPDPEIQKLVESVFLLGREPESFAAGMRELADRREHSLTKQAWLEQSLVFLSGLDNGGWPADLFLAQLSKLYMQIDPETAATALAPYLDLPDQRARIAEEMLWALMAFMPTGEADITGARQFSAFRPYLESCAPAEPSAGALLTMYDADPDAAINTILPVYFADDPAQRDRIQRLRKQVLVLMLEHDLADDAQKPQAARELLAKLDELAAHPHWCVRIYALAMIHRADRVAPRRTASWSRETDIPSRLSNDPSPSVALMAKSLARLINLRRLR